MLCAMRWIHGRINSDGHMKKPLISVEHLSVFIHHKRVVDDVSFSLRRGECMALVGESGSGKSITALAMMQLLPSVARVDKRSKVVLYGDVLDYSEAMMRHIRGLRMGMIFQDAMSAFNPVLTVGQQMLEVLVKTKQYSARARKARALLLLQKVGIQDVERCFRAYPHELSGGMRQRAMIAMALSGEPEIIIADEPTTALDVTIQAQVLDLLRQLLADDHITLLFISHDLAVVSELADHITVMQQGKVVEDATCHDFFRHPVHPYSQRLLACVPTQTARQPLDPSVGAEPLLSVNALKVYFPIRKGLFKHKVGEVKAVDAVSFSIAAGKTLALVGESGSGKTSTAKAIIRLVKHTGGDLRFDGIDIHHLSRANLRRYRQSIQIIFQDPYASLNPRRMVADSIMEGMITQGIGGDRQQRLARVDALLKKVGLHPEHKWRYPHQFSGGERQRICIARALALKPKLLILDEPTSALDVSIQMQVLRLLETLQAEDNIAYLLITHDIAVVAYLSHTMAVMYRGEIVERGQTARVLNAPEHAYTKTLLAAVPRLPKETTCDDA
jgi:peptide/nickel transport system ATP-binding protein